MASSELKFSLLRLENRLYDFETESEDSVALKRNRERVQEAAECAFKNLDDRDLLIKMNGRVLNNFYSGITENFKAVEEALGNKERNLVAKILEILKPEFEKKQAAKKILNWLQKRRSNSTVMQILRKSAASFSQKEKAPLRTRKALKGAQREVVQRTVASWPQLQCKDAKCKGKCVLVGDYNYVKEQIAEEVSFPGMIPIVVVDGRNNIQALALATQHSDFIKLEYLMTAPWNLNHPTDFNSANYEQLRGTATAAIEEIFFLCLRKNLPLKVLPLKSSEEYYYTKLEFPRQLNGESVYPLKQIPDFFRSDRGGAIPLKN